jgi:hypothetical protein
MREYDEEEDLPEREFRVRAALPASVRAAGIIWIVFGGLLVVSVVLMLAQAGGAAAAGGPKEAAPAAAGGVCGALLVGLFAAAFIFVGVQSVKGTARDTLGNGIGSIVFGLLNLGWGLVLAGLAAVLAGGRANAGWAAVLAGSISAVTGVALLVAGVLALVGRGDYRAWRQAQRPRRRRYER